MWLSEMRRKDTEGADAAVVRASDTAGELLRPAGALRIPKDGESVAVLYCSDGTELILGKLGGASPEDLNEGEIYIATDSAQITIKNNGAVNIEGIVNITGSLTVNGVSIS